MKRPAALLLMLLACAVAHASRTLTDELGRKVVVPDHPHRILCLAPSVVDDVYALGGGDDVAAVTDYAKYPKQALSKPSVGEPMQPSLEAVVAVHPDLVIGFATGEPLAIHTQIAALGFPVFLVAPHGIDGLLHSILSIGTAIDRTQQAASVVQSLKSRIDAVRARTHVLERTAVFMPVWYDPIVTIGRHAFITELISAAGGRSITEDLPSEWPSMSLEAVVARKPDALLLVRGSRTTFDVLKDRPGWSALPAIQHHKVFYVDDRIDLASPVAIDALEDLAHQFHP